MDNCYEDVVRAEAYAQLEFPATYYLAYRDLPEILRQHVRGRQALDFGCGTGRSTRFLKGLGFDAAGADISQQMIDKARERDPAGTYHLITPGDLSRFPEAGYDLVLSAFTFDNVPAVEKPDLLLKLRTLLRAEGRLIHLVSAPEIYLYEWASFSTRDFPENRQARSGDVVKIIGTDNLDRRPVEDVLTTDAAYRELFRGAGLSVVGAYHPLANPEEPYPWVNETAIAPWTIYVLGPASPAQSA